MKTFIIYSLLLFSYTSFGQVFTRNFPYRLSGEVKSVRTTIDYVDSDINIRIENEIDKDQLLLFDKKGQLTEQILYDQGKPTTLIKYLFDNQNRLSKKERRYYKDNFTDITTFSFDKKENLYRGKRTLSLEPGVTYKELFLLNEKENVKEYIQYDVDGSLYLKIIYNFDNKGNCTEQSFSNKENKKTRSNFFTYDVQNRITEHIIEDYENFITSKSLYTYEEYRFPASQKESSNGSFPFYSTIKYKIDKYGNWTEKTYCYDNIPMAVVKREISYY